MVREFIFCSLILWQIGFIVYLLLNKFYQPKKLFTTQSSAVEVDLPKKKIEHVDIKMKKQINTQKPTSAYVKSDEVIKGKVKTQKHKLKKLRGL
jgi:hypothetical protein|tara:strand:+ start:796 stop:1077 length:282 start_codon:yes stop_codon:yes gene_type:complete